MKILVTGATGFIGSHLVKQLLKENHSLFCTLLNGETNPFIEDKVESIVFSDHSLDENVSFFKRNNIEGIIHLASFVQSGEHKPSDIEALIDTNVKFSVILLETAVQAQVKWFINTGTYWQNYNNQDYSPVNLYAATKEAFMSIAKYYIETNQILFTTIKLFDTYGPNDSRPKIFNLWEQIAKTGETLNMSPGEQLIDISYIDDIIEAFILLSNHLHNEKSDIKNGDIWVVKANERYSLKELATLFEETTGNKLNICWGGRPYRKREIMKPWENGKTVPNWKSKTTIPQGILRLLQDKSYCKE